jgi:aryl-alcohol dehydrogenase-like predicted oxidoreductase
MATKVWTHGRDQGVRQIEESLRRMRVERMDLMQIHNLADVETHTRTLKDMKAAERIRYMGITHYSGVGLPRDRAPAEDAPIRLPADQLLARRARSRKDAPAARSRPEGGGDREPAVPGRRAVQPRQGKPLPAWAAELGIASWAQYFLKWIVSHPALTCVDSRHRQAGPHPRQRRRRFDPLPDAPARTKMAEYFDSL